MKIKEKFLNSYKSLEEVCRNENIDLKDFAETLNDLDKNRLTICRQMRNYLSHNNDSLFLDITENQISFLEKIKESILYKSDTFINHLNKNKNTFYCEQENKCIDILEVMNKKKLNYIISKKDNEYIILDIHDICELALISKTKKIKDVKPYKISKIHFVKKTDKYISPDNKNIVLCTTNGEKNGELLGIVK